MLGILQSYLLHLFSSFHTNFSSVIQCCNGHTICSGCKPRVHNRCPTCRHELGNIRCLALEKIAASLELPCKYQNFGCMGIYPYYSKLKHESQCAFRPYNCPYAGSECTVIGDIPFLVAHLKDDHKVDMHNGSTFNHRYVKSNPHEVENATWMLTVSTNFFMFRLIFLCHAMLKVQQYNFDKHCCCCWICKVTVKDILNSLYLRILALHSTNSSGVPMIAAYFIHVL